MSRSAAALVCDAVDHLGAPGAEWVDDFPSGEEVSITAPPALLRNALLVAIDECGDRIAQRCGSLLRGSGDANQIEAAVADLGSLVSLLRESS